MLGEVFERFVKQAPGAVMVRGILERVLSPDALDTLFERVADKQYTRELLFSSIFQLMNLVVCKVHPSIYSAYQDNKKEVGVSITAVYDKLNRMDISTSGVLVRDTASQLEEAIRAMDGACVPLIPGYRCKMLDGNCIEATDHRLEVLRENGSAALPGKSLVIYDPELEMATDVFPCEDGHAQERSLLGEILPTLEARDVLVMDRNFCVRDFLHGICAQEAFFICRQHKGLPWEADGEKRYIGKSESGAIHEQSILVSDSEGNTKRFRRISIVLKTPTRDGDKVLNIVTNLPESAADAKLIAEIYRKRWSIETAFQELEAHLHSEINSLGYPRAALFGFCTALVAYNALAVVKAALRSQHGEEKIANDVSGYYLAGHFARIYEGMMIAIPEEEWTFFQTMGLDAFTRTLQQLAGNIDLEKFKKHKRGPKKKMPKRTYDKKKPHVSTYRLLMK
jgi:hypothetical protein